MIAFCFILSFVFTFNSIPRLRKIRAGLSEDALKYYTDILRPFFLKFYFAGFTPTILFILLVNIGENDQVWYAWSLWTATLIWDLITTIKLSKLINRSSFVTEFASLHYTIGMMKVGRLLFLFALMNYTKIGFIQEA